MQKCYDEGVDLSAKALCVKLCMSVWLFVQVLQVRVYNVFYMQCIQEGTESPFVYNSYGVACSEVEVNVLTGQTEVLRVDILYDCGERYRLATTDAVALLPNIVL